MFRISDHVRRYSRTLIRPAAAALLCAAAGLAQVVIGPPQTQAPQPVMEPGCGMAKAFKDVAIALAEPNVRSTSSFCAAYASKFQAASARLVVAQGQVASLRNLLPAHAPEAQQIEAALGMICLGFDGIAADFNDTDLGSPLSYWVAADGLTQLSGLLAFLHPELVDAGVAAGVAANLFSTMSLSITAPTQSSVAAYWAAFFSVVPSLEAVAHALEIDPAVAGAMATGGSTSVTCPPGSVPDCETNEWETYGAWSCNGWTRFSGGISVVVIEFCPDGGLWRRTWTRSVTGWSQMICCCYESRWDRFWGIGGFNYSIGAATSSGSTTESKIENEWSCFGSP